MSAVLRRIGRLLGRAAGRIEAIDNGKLLQALLAAGTLLAFALVVFGSFLGGAFGAVLNSILYIFAAMLPLWGILLAALLLRWRSEYTLETRGPIRSPPPEVGVTGARDPVGHDVQRRLDEATRDRYLARHTSSENVEATLREGAIRRTRTRLGRDEPTARSLVDAGEWTDDRVAAAFLSEKVSYPPEERLRGAFDPGSAYIRRVRRTADAIDAPDDASDDQEGGE